MDYYDVLNIGRNAPGYEVSRAYRKQVKEHHPDQSDHPNAAEIFKHIQNAYEVLSDENERRKYENMEHDEYVRRNGGYTEDEFRELYTTKTRIVEYRGGRENTYESSEDIDESGEARRDALVKQMLYLFFQGTTPENTTMYVYGLRLVVYAALFALVAVPVALVVGRGGYWSSFPAVFGSLFLSRVVYVVAFDHFREGYVRIDKGKQPEVKTVYTALVVAGGAAALAGLTWLIDSPLLALLSVPAVALAGFWLILSVGWTAADDKYNHDVKTLPEVWNLAIQTPVLILVAVLVTGVSGSIAELAVLSVPALMVVVAVAFLGYRWGADAPF